MVSEESRISIGASAATAAESLATVEGRGLLHSHILEHAESGMMTTMMEVQP